MVQDCIDLILVVVSANIESGSQVLLGLSPNFEFCFEPWAENMNITKPLHVHSVWIMKSIHRCILVPCE